MADDYLFLACRLCGEGLMAAKMSSGYDADGGVFLRPGEWVGDHIERCGLPAIRRQNLLPAIGDLVKQMIGLFTEKDVTWMGYLTPEDEKNGHCGCRIKPELRMTELKK